MNAQKKKDHFNPDVSKARHHLRQTKDHHQYRDDPEQRTARSVMRLVNLERGRATE